MSQAASQTVRQPVRQSDSQPFNLIIASCSYQLIGKSYIEHLPVKPTTFQLPLNNRANASKRCRLSPLTLSSNLRQNFLHLEKTGSVAWVLVIRLWQWHTQLQICNRSQGERLTNYSQFQKQSQLDSSVILYQLLACYSNAQTNVAIRNMDKQAVFQKLALRTVVVKSSYHGGFPVAISKTVQPTLLQIKIELNQIRSI